MSGIGIIRAICKSASSSRQKTSPAPHHSVPYRPDALPAAQPTNTSKHWRPNTTKHNQTTQKQNSGLGRFQIFARLPITTAKFTNFQDCRRSAAKERIRWKWTDNIVWYIFSTKIWSIPAVNTQICKQLCQVHSYCSTATVSSTLPRWTQLLCYYVHFCSDSLIFQWYSRSICIPPVFTARCYASAVLAMALCPSVCPSVTSRCSTKMAKRRITQTTPHDTPKTLVFWCQRSPRNSTGVTPYDGAECRWGGSKSATFD